MITAIQERPGYYWKLDDAGGLRYGHANGEAPTTLECFEMEARGVARKLSVPLARLEFMAVARFGEGRPAGLTANTKWTGSSHSYALYDYSPEFGSRRVVMVENHGGGMVCYIFDYLVGNGMWSNLVSILQPEQLWDVCHLFAATYNAARAHEKTEIYTAFAEKRMKARRKAGKIIVEIVPREAK